MSTYQGLVTAEVAEYLHGRGIGREEAATSRLGVVGDPYPGHERFRGMLAIPYLSKDGYPLTVRFRCITKGCDHRPYHGKYNTIKDDTPRLYGVGAIHRAGETIHVTEGELDAVILNKIGLDAIAVPGANIWQGRHRRMLAGFNRVWVWGDPDDAGQEFAGKLMRQLRRAKAVRLTVGDVTDTYIHSGADALLDLIKEG